MKRTLTILVIAFIVSGFATSVVAQSNDTVRYSVVRDDPYTIPKFYISIIPLNVEYNKTFNLNFGARIQYDINKLIGIRALYTMQYPLSINIGKSTSSNGTIFNDFDYANTYYKNADLGIDFTIGDKMRTENTTILLKSRRSNLSYNVTLITNQVMQNEIIHRRVSKIRLGGIFNISNFVNKGSLVTTDGTVFDENGVSFHGVDYDNLEEPEYGGEYIINEGYSNINSKVRTKQTLGMVYVGYSSSSIKNRIVDVENYGIRGFAKYTTIYVDAIVAVHKSLSPFYFATAVPGATIVGEEYDVNALTEYTIDTENEEFKFLPAGVRVGCIIKRPLFSRGSSFEGRILTVERPVNLSYLFEGGLQPTFGKVTGGLYLSIGLALDINPF